MRIKKASYLLIAAVFMCLISVLGACSGKKGQYDCDLFPVVYDGINTVTDITAYNAAVADDKATDNGVIMSPYFSAEINGESIPVYAARTTNGIHSFSYIDVASKNTDGSFKLNLKITVSDVSSVLDKPTPEVVVLPESSKIAANIKGRTVSAVIDKTGSFSFAFNKKYFEPVTFFVADYQEFAAPEGYSVVDIEPGEHAADKTVFTAGNTVYRLKAGRHKIDQIALPSDSELHLERGSYLEIQPSPANRASLLRSSGENVRVTGRGLIDLSACGGGDGAANNKSGVSFYEASNVLFEGVVFINSQTWTLCFTDCEDILIRNCMFFAYRTYADGVMLSDCRNAVVEDSFMRTGDDGFETKSTSSSGSTDNVLFQRCAAWTDKGSAFGCIYESNHDTQNVWFKNCSVGFAIPTWANHCGCLVIQMGNVPDRKIHDIHFEDIEIYSTENPMMNISIRRYSSFSAYGYIYDIYFKNITARRNNGVVVLNIRTEDNVNCRVGKLYLDNIVSNGTAITSENLVSPLLQIYADYNKSNIKINTLG